MIIGSFKRLDIGHIYNKALYDKDCVLRLATFQILREATRQEYLDYLESQGVSENYHPGDSASYYQISMD